MKTHSGGKTIYFSLSDKSYLRSEDLKRHMIFDEKKNWLGSILQEIFNNNLGSHFKSNDFWLINLII